MAKKQMSEAESLKRSHSGVSNFKLTLVCLLLAISFPVFLAALGTLGTDVLPGAVTVLAMIASGALTALSLVLISIFKR